LIGNNDGGKDKITLEIPKGWNDAGDFHKVCIKISGHPEFAFENMDGWIKNEKEFILKEGIKNIIDNNYFLLYPITKNENALLLIGYGYASNPSRLNVIVLNNDYPEVIFSEDMVIRKYMDLNCDSIPDFVLLPWLSETYGPDFRFKSYVPYLVYTMIRQSGQWKMIYDEKLSIQYTNDNSYGWAGRNFSDSLVVFKPKNENKPRVMKLKEAEKLYKMEK